MILAIQLSQVYRISANEVLAGLKDWEADYKAVFLAADRAVRFELLIDLLSRILGVVPVELPNLRLHFDPLYPQKGRPERSVAGIMPREYVERLSGVDGAKPGVLKTNT
jgi:hypothetical protein